MVVAAQGAAAGGALSPALAFDYRVAQLTGLCDRVVSEANVLTSRPLPANAPGDVIIARDGPAKLAEQLRSRGSGGDVHLVGGPQAIRAFQELGALDRPGILVLPVLLGSGIPLSRRGPREFRWACYGRTGPSPTARSSWSMRRNDQRPPTLAAAGR